MALDNQMADFRDFLPAGVTIGSMTSAQSSAALRAAFQYCQANLSNLFLPTLPGTQFYWLDGPLVVNTGFEIFTGGQKSDGANTRDACAIKAVASPNWVVGGVTQPMLTVLPTGMSLDSGYLDNQYVRGLAFHGLVFNGADIAAGLNIQHLAETELGSFGVVNCRDYHVNLRFCKLLCIQNLGMRAKTPTGAGATPNYSKGLVINDCTRLSFYYTTADMHYGNCIEIGNLDASVWHHTQLDTIYTAMDLRADPSLLSADGSWGWGIVLKGFGGAYPPGIANGARMTNTPRKIKFNWLSATVLAQPGAQASIGEMNGEDTYTRALDGAYIGLRVVDDEAGTLYEKPPYPLNDSLDLVLADGVAQTGTPVLAAVGNFRGVLLDGNATETWGWSTRMPPRWRTGKLSAELILCPTTAAPGQQVALTVSIGYVPLGGSVASAGTLQSYSVLTNIGALYTTSFVRLPMEFPVASGIISGLTPANPANCLIADGTRVVRMQVANVGAIKTANPATDLPPPSMVHINGAGHANINGTWVARTKNAAAVPPEFEFVVDCEVPAGIYALNGSAYVIVPLADYVGETRHMLAVRVARNGASVDDTYNADLAVLGVRLNWIANANVTSPQYIYRPGSDVRADWQGIHFVSNTNPCQIRTFAAHPMKTGDKVYVQGVNGVTDAGGVSLLNSKTFSVTLIDNRTLSLNGLDTTTASAYVPDSSLVNPPTSGLDPDHYVGVIAMIYT